MEAASLASPDPIPDAAVYRNGGDHRPSESHLNGHVNGHGGHMPAMEDWPHLSDREWQILDGLVKGHANKVIARERNITEATVKVHMKSILRKIRVGNRTQAAVWAIEHGSTPQLLQEHLKNALGEL